MQLFIEETYEDMSRRAADLIAAQLIVDPASTCWAWPPAPRPSALYADLVERLYRRATCSFRQVPVVQPGRVLRPGPGHDQSYRYFMQQNLFDHVEHRPEATPTSPTAWPRHRRRACDAVRRGHPARPAASTCSCWASATTATSASTSPATHFTSEHPRGGADGEHHRGQQPLLRLRRRGAPPGRAPWASSTIMQARQGAGGWSAARTRREIVQEGLLPAPSRPRCPPPSCSCTPT